jgi:nucleoid DNA-binding protein
MTSVKYVPTTRKSAEKIVMRNGQFVRWLARRSGVSHQALSSALMLLSKGIIEALANGFDVGIIGLGVFETRELQPRKRYQRLTKSYYISKPSVIVHFKKAYGLSYRVRAMAEAQLSKTMNTATVHPMVRK